MEHHFEVFYKAVNIANDYLLSISRKLQRAPSLETLAVACVVIASKTIRSGTIARCIIQNACVELKSILTLEFEILKELEFDINRPTILDF